MFPRLMNCRLVVDVTFHKSHKLAQIPLCVKGAVMAAKGLPDFL